MWFKQNCKYLAHDYDFNKDICCTREHDSQEIFTVDPKTKHKHYYYPCKEKYCPILQACKEANK